MFSVKMREPTSYRTIKTLLKQPQCLNITSVHEADLPHSPMVLRGFITIQEGRYQASDLCLLYGVREEEPSHREYDRRMVQVNSWKKTLKEEASRSKGNRSLGCLND